MRRESLSIDSPPLAAATVSCRSGTLSGVGWVG